MSSSSPTQYPLLKFLPVLKRIRWGGRRLQTVLEKNLGEGNDFAESWEVSCHPDGLSVVDGGPFDGRTLESLVKRDAESILGANCRGDEFPLLIKLLDANDRLSVQVHPNDQQAAQFPPGENGKTEAWVILDVRPESRLYVGLKTGVDRSRLKQALDDETVAECLHTYTVSAGDCVFIPAGTVHAIGEGVLLAEVQQSSNLTFRLFDWGRFGTDGQPRPLHIEQALACIDFDRGPVDPVVPAMIADENPRTELLVNCPFFEMRRHTSASEFAIRTHGSFHVLLVLDGEATFSVENDHVTLRTGETLLTPACHPSVEIAPGNDAVVVLDAFVPGK